MHLQQKRWYFGMYISLGLAVLTKGPVGVLLPGLVMVIFLGVHNYLRATVSEHPKDNVIYYYIVVFCGPNTERKDVDCSTGKE